MSRMTAYHWPGHEIIDAAQGGDPHALEALILGSHPHVTRFALRLCSSRDDAEDAAQEALTVLYREVGSLRVAAALSSWAFQIVKNECLRRSRGAMRRRESTSRLADLASRTEGRTAEDLALGRMEAQRVAAAICELPPGFREVLVMRDVQGLSGGEVARRLGLSTAAMKSTLHRARLALRVRLQEPNPCD